MPSRARVLQSRTVFRGRVVTLTVDRVVEPGGVTGVREVVRHRGSVVILPRLPDGRVILVRQFRYATGQHLWELVAGGMEDGETAEDAARRELLEETGYRATSLSPLFTFFSSPGFLSERMNLFEARGLIRSRAQREPDERIRLGRLTPRELRQMLLSGKIQDAKTLVGVLWLLRSTARGRPKVS